MTARRKYADCYRGGVYSAGPRRNRTRDAMAALGRGEARSAEAYLAIANDLRALAEDIGRNALRARLQRHTAEDQRRALSTPLCQIYMIGGVGGVGGVGGERGHIDPRRPGQTFPPRQPKRAMFVVDTAPARLPAQAELVDLNRHAMRGWVAARDHLHALGSELWWGAFWRAMFDQATLRDCARLLSISQGRGLSQVKTAFRGALDAAERAMG